MILTVTMNPSIDTRYSVEHLVIDDVNRVTPHKTAGGKGLNVSRVLVQLGDEVLATGLLGGHSGAYLGDLMDADHIPHRFTPVAGESRTCIALLHDGNQTELLESGPAITPEELEAKRKEVANFQYDASTRLQMRNSLTLSKEEVDALIAEGKQYVVR